MKLTSTLKLSTYGCKVVLIITDSLINEANKVYKKHKMEQMFEGDAEGTVITPDIDVYYMIIEQKYLSHNTLSHENYHMVNVIKSDRGIVDDEAGAWLSGHIAEFIYKFIDKKQLIVKHYYIANIPKNNFLI